MKLAGKVAASVMGKSIAEGVKVIPSDLNLESANKVGY